MLDDVKKRYPVDPAHVYLTGHSLGGTGAACFAMRHPDQLAVAAPYQTQTALRGLP